MPEEKIPFTHDRTHPGDLPSLKTPEQYITDTKKFFQTMDIPIGSDGLMNQNLTPAQIEKLSDWSV